MGDDDTPTTTVRTYDLDDVCSLVDGGTTDQYTMDGTGEPDGSMGVSGMYCWVVETTPSPVTTPDPVTELPATGLDPVALGLAAVLCVFGAGLRRIART